MKIPSLSFLSLFSFHLRVAPAVFLLFSIGGGPPLLHAGETFFAKKEIRFWDSPHTGPPRETVAELFPENANMPPPVQTLILSPTRENAFRYLAWQRKRMLRIRRAIQALQSARKTPLLFTRPDCPYCREQERILQRMGLRHRRIDPLRHPELAEHFEVTAVPTLFLNGKIHQGVASVEKLRALLGKPK